MKRLPVRAQEFKKGEVTAFLALIFILLVSFVGSLMESASLQAAKSYRRADMNRAMESVFAEYQRELLEEFDIFALEGSYESGVYGEEKVLNRLSYYGASGMDQQIERIRLLTDDHGAPFLEQISYFIESKYGLSSLNHLLDGMGSWEGKEEEAGQYQELGSGIWQELSDTLSEQELKLPEQDNPLPNVQRLAAAPLVDLTMPKDSPASEKTAAVDELVSHRERRQGYGEFSDTGRGQLLSGAAFGEYVMTHFASAVSEGEQSRTGGLDYEVEYILSGEAGDRQNLEEVLRKLLMLRLVPNYAYLRQDAAKQAEAQALALTLCTVMAFPAAAEVLAEVMLFAWAFGESILDLRSLLQGNRVPLAKTGESWQLPLSGLLTLGTDDGYREGRDTAGGLSYGDYLRVLLFFQGESGQTLRALDMVELRLQTEKGMSWFRADHCVSGMEVQSTVSLRRGITYQFHTFYEYR